MSASRSKRSENCSRDFDGDDAVQPGVAGLGFGGSFLVRPAELAGNWHRAGFTESQIPRAGTTAEGADAAHILRLFVE